MEPIEILNKMMSKDAFSQWLGIKVVDLDKGSCTLEMTVKPEMVNGFEISHGGIVYSLSDSCLAFAANAYGNVAVSIETSISHTRPAKINDRLTAKCTELNRGKSIGIYEVTVKNQEGKTISLFKGTVFINKEKKWC